LNEMEYCTGKGLIWCDPLYTMMEYGFESVGGAAERYKKAANALAESSDSLECRYAVSCFNTAAQKGEMIEHLRGRYLAGDKEYLRRVAEQLIPELQESYQKLMEVHRQLWERDMKRFGWEVLVLRYGGAIARLADVKDELDRYLNGMLSSIPELEEEPLHMSRRAGQHYQGFATPMYYL